MWRDKFKKYSMHESIIQKIKCENGKLTFVFNPDDGYSLFNREKSILEPPIHDAVMEFQMGGLTKDRTECYMQLILQKKRKIKYIDFPTLCKMLEKDAFRIQMEYITYLDESLLIVGNINKWRLFCKLNGIDDVIFKARESSAA